MMQAIRDHENTREVYGCPYCWMKLEKQCGFYYCLNVGRCIHARKSITIDKKHIEIFDSQAEHAYGVNVLKPLERAGEITDLQHHEAFELLRNAYYDPIAEAIFFESESKPLAKHQKKHHIKIPHNFKQYESDFTYIAKGKKIVVEYKGIQYKKRSKTIKDALNGTEYKREFNIPWPYFPKSQSETQFKLKCRLMKAICKIDVQVQAGKFLFRYNEKWQLKEVKI